MKINIEVEQKVSKEIELETPAYFKNDNDYALINDDLIVKISSISILKIPKESYLEGYNRHLNDLVSKCKPCAKEEFYEAYSNLISDLNEVILEKELA